MTDEIDHLHQEKRLLCEVLKQRSSKSSRKNLERARSIIDEIAQLDLDGRRELDGLSRIDTFRAYFDDTVFSSIVHTTAASISDTPTTLLESPAKLGKKAHSLTVDDEIGNTSYVFASSDALRSNSSRHRKEYEIDSRDCFVVPIDIDHVKVGLPNLSNAEYELEQIRRYASNMFTYKDFREYFAAYNAAVFDTPEQALDFYTRYHYVPDQADFLDESRLRFFDDPTEQEAFRKIQLLYREDVLPPFSPEFQFKDSVVGKLRNQD